MAAVSRCHRINHRLCVRAGKTTGKRLACDSTRAYAAAFGNRSPLDQKSSAGHRMLTFAYPWMFAIIVAPFVIRRFAPAHKESATGVRVPFLRRVADATHLTPTKGAV